MNREIPVQINNRMGGQIQMQNLDATLEDRVSIPKQRQRRVITASDSEEAFNQAGKALSVTVSWVAGLSLLYLLVQMLRWVSNG